MGISGACRRDELVRMTIDDIEDVGSILIIKLPDTKTNMQRTFIVSKSEYIELYRKYFVLRPPNASSKRLFLKYHRGRCFNQVVGINKIGEMPSLIAKYLGLPNPKQFTGHCFRRSSVTLLADAGAGMSNIKRHGGWKSTSIAEGYIEDSISNKIKISNKILNCEVSAAGPVPSSLTENSLKGNAAPKNLLSAAGLSIGSCRGCTINVNISNNTSN